MDHGPADSSVHGDSPGKNTGVRCHVLLQGRDFLTQGLNLNCLCLLTAGRFLSTESPGKPNISGKWNLPRPGIKTVFPAVTGGFLTTEPPGKSGLQDLSRGMWDLVS